MSQLDDLTGRIVEIQTARNWKQFHSPKNLAITLVEEAVEILSEFRFVEEAHSAEKLSEEAGDVFYSFLLFCHETGIDPIVAIEHTLAKIEMKYPVDKAHSSPRKYDHTSE